MKVHRLIYNGGAQNLTTIPVDKVTGVPLYVTSATYEILDLREGDGSSNRTVASGSVTFGGIDDTLSAAAGPAENNDKLVTVSDVSSYVEGTTYLLQGLQHTELFVAHEIDTTNNLIYARTPLRYDHAVTTTAVRSVEMTVSFPAAEINDESETIDDKGGPYAVVWDFAAGGREYNNVEPIFIVRYDDAPFITEPEVLLAYPGLASRARDPGVADAIKVATDDFLADIEAAGKDPAYFKTSRSGKIAVRNKAIEYLLRWQQTDDDDANADRWEARYKELMAGLLTGVPDHGTIEIHPVDDEAPAGSSQEQVFDMIRRS